jgi:hypothetical protein
LLPTEYVLKLDKLYKKIYISFKKWYTYIRIREV